MLTTLVAAIWAMGSPAIAVKPIQTFPSLRVVAVEAAPTGSRFAVSLEDYSVRIMDAATRKTVVTLQPMTQAVYGLAFDPKGNILATADESGRIWLHDVKTGKKIKEFSRSNAHVRGIQRLGFSADGKLLASTGRDDVIIVWTVPTGQQVRKLLGKGANFYSAQFSPAGGILATGTLGPGAAFFATKGWAHKSYLKAHGNQGVFDIAFDPKGRRMISGGRDGKACVWDVKSMRQLATLSAHDDMVLHVALAPSAAVAASSSSDRRVIVWDLNTRKPISTLENKSAVGSPIAFTADGKYLVTASASDALELNSITPPVGLEPTKAPAVRRRR